MPVSLENLLAGVVGAAHVLTDETMCAPYDTDWTRRFTGRSRLVVRPASTDEVAAVVRACAEAGAAIVAQGGNTGLVGGGVPRSGEIVLSLRRLDTVTDVDVAGARVEVGAGATLATVQSAARRAGLDFGIDLGARDSATIGGMIATNAGGIRVIRHGSMRSQLLGIEAVLADGSVLSRLAATSHDNSGYDLVGLLAGSEGTLAVITRATLRLVAAQPVRAVALLGLPDTESAVRVAAHARTLPSLDAIEIFYADGLALVCAHAGLRTPFAAPSAAYVLIELAGPQAEEQLAGALGELAVDDVAFAVAPDDRRRFWDYRERIAEAIAAQGVPHKLDVAVPLARLAGFVDALVPLVASIESGARCVVFGHLGVGNLHVNLLGLPLGDTQADDAVLELVAAVGGSVGAEHGIGIAKREHLHLTRSAADIAAMRAIKDAWDPAGLLNPGVLFPAERVQAG